MIKEEWARSERRGFEEEEYKVLFCVECSPKNSIIIVVMIFIISSIHFFSFFALLLFEFVFYRICDDSMIAAFGYCI